MANLVRMLGELEVFICRSFVGLTTIILITSQPVWAAKRAVKNWDHKSEKQTKCYRLAELDAEKSKDYDAPPLDEILCVSKGNLKQYPRSVVTFTMYHGSPEKRPHHRYHYKMLKKNEFGRNHMIGKASHSDEAKARVIFDERRKTVFLGFIKNGGKEFRYVPIENSASPYAVHKSNKRAPASEPEKK